MAAATFRAINPTFTIATGLPKYRNASVQQRYYDALKAAGLPE
jgi:hypothetical protein